MAKGKQALKAARRREREAQEEREEAARALKEAKDEIADLQHQLRYMDALKADNEKLRQQVEEGASDRLSRAEADLARLRGQFDGATKYVNKVAEAWNNLQDAAVVAMDTPTVERASRALVEAMGAEVPDEVWERLEHRAREHEKALTQTAYRLGVGRPRRAVGPMINDPHMLIPDDEPTDG